MDGDGILDYAEFQLSPRRTRCELFVSADGLRERIATGSVNPFAAHLREVEVQIGSGARAIRLNNQSSKRQTDGNLWFRKGTLERFVQFVSSPDVIERVKAIEDELIQLQQVHNTLEDTFSQRKDMSLHADSINDHHHARYGTQPVPGAPSMVTVDNQADVSRKELLRAMGTRLNALRHEQNMAFARATAAGFDYRCIRDLMTFAEKFGATRLRDACAQFLALSRERLASRKERQCQENDSALESGKLVPDEESCFLRTKRRLDFGGQTKQSDGFHAEEKARIVKITGMQSFGPHQAAREPDNDYLGFARPRDQQTQCVSGSSFGHCLQKMDQNLETRWREDSNSLSARENSDSAQSSESLNENELDLTTENEFPRGFTMSQTSNQSQSFKEGKLTSSLIERSLSLPSQKITVDSQCASYQSLIDICNADNNNCSEAGGINRKHSFKKFETYCFSEKVINDNQNTKDEAPARRLSVAAAISLFESKKKDLAEVPLKKFGKQESRRPFTENGDFVAEKSVLKRWTSNLLNKTENMELKNISRNEADNNPVNLSENDLESKNISPSVAAENPETDVEKGYNESISHNKSQYKVEESKATSSQKSVNDLQRDDNNQIDGHTATDPEVQSGKRRSSFQQTVKNTDHSETVNIRPQNNVPVRHDTVEAVVKSIKVSKESEETDFKDRLASDRHSADSIKLSFLKTEFPANILDTQMQSLVKMMENPITILSFNDTYVLPEIQGKYYDQYSQLRDAKLKHENPIKRAEKEAKMKLMQETLDRRKAEIQSKSLQSSDSKPQSRHGGRAQKIVFHVGQNDVKVYNECIDQEYQKDVQRDYSCSSLQCSARNQSSLIKSHATVKVASNSIKPLSAQTLIRPALSISKPVSKASHGRMTSPEMVSMQSSITKTNAHSSELKKNVMKNTSIYGTLCKSNTSS